MDANRVKRKRPLPLILNGAGSSGASSGCINLNNGSFDRSSDFSCPICFETIEEAHVTECGHTFCFKCISRSLESSNRCPNCNYVVDKVFPNFLLNNLITKTKRNKFIKALDTNQDSAKALVEWQDMISKKTNNLHLSDIDFLLGVLSEKKKEYEMTSRAIQTELLRDFLNQVRKHKQEQLHLLTSELKVIEGDSIRLDKMGNLKERNITPAAAPVGIIEPNTPLIVSLPFAKLVDETTSEPSNSSSSINNNQRVVKDSGAANEKIPKSVLKSDFFCTTLATRKKKMRLHFEDLEQCYFNLRAKNIYLSSPDDDRSYDGLDEFMETLNKLTLYNNLRPLATLCYTVDPFNSSSIVSSIEFDKDNEIFAIAGVTKKIKLFEYSMVVKDSLAMHYPITEMECKSKISCVSWSSYYKSLMASSDYEGTVTIWDAYTKQQIKNLQEHEKRCWSVDFNKVDTNLVSSGSDDAKVKLWSLNMDKSIASLEAKANVCCVKFNPMTRYHVAFGSADHCVYYYDLRNYKTPQAIFKGHRKAVSYVKFLTNHEIVSASTDSQLKLWDTSKAHCQRSFKGHINEKNFVGLATDGDYVSCGSENNSLYLYYKGLSKPALTFSFDANRVVNQGSIKDRDKKEEESSDFVSAICWKSGTNVIVAANSQGIIKILEMV